MILVQSESTENYMKSHKIKKYFNVILNIAGHRLFSFIKMFFLAIEFIFILNFVLTNSI